MPTVMYDCDRRVKIETAVECRGLIERQAIDMEFRIVSAAIRIFVNKLKGMHFERRERQGIAKQKRFVSDLARLALQPGAR